MNRFLLKWYLKMRGKNPGNMPMVQYWKKMQSQQARITKDKDGGVVMDILDERYTFPTFPRAHMLMGVLSKLKHEVKNQIFNESWWELEHTPEQEVIRHIKDKFFGKIVPLADSMRYERLPFKSMTPSMKELWRAWDAVGGNPDVRDIITFILQEDDGYRFRFQWLVEYFNPNAFWNRFFRRDVLGMFDYSFQMLEHAEIIGDMKERVRLVRRILMLLMEDEKVCTFFLKLCKEIDWNKIRLTQGDKFHLRGKWFKADYGLLEY